MNIQPGNSSGRRRGSEPKSSAHGGMEALMLLFARVGSTAMVILILGAFFHTYIKLDQDINTITREIRDTDANIATLKRDIESLDMRLARYSTREFIERQIARFRLNLVELRQDQQITVKLYNEEQLAYFFMHGTSPEQIALDNRYQRRR